MSQLLPRRQFLLEVQERILIMPYTSFHDHFREIVKKETRTITIMREDDIVPKGSDGLLEMYCDDPSCDCRRVFIEVFDWEWGKDMRSLLMDGKAGSFTASG